MTSAPAEGLGPRLLVPLCLGAVLNAMNSTMIATALAPIGNELDVGAAATAWLVSAMYLASAIGQPVAGRLADQFGPRRVFLAGAVLVAVAGIMGAFAATFAWLVAARAVVGLGTGAAYPAAVAMIRERAPAGGGAAARAIGILNTASLVMLTVGPPAGGVLVDTVGWRAVFAVNAPLGVLVLALGLRYLPRSRPRTRAMTGWWRVVDLPGMVLFGGTISLLLVVLLGLPRPPWVAAAGLVACALFLVVVELRTRQPLLDVRMLAGNRSLVLAYLRIVLTFVVIYGVLFGLTPWLQEGRGLSASAAGLLMLSMSAVGALVAPAGARARRLLWPLLVATGGLVAGSVAIIAVDAAVPIALLAVVIACFGLPNGLGQVGNQVAVYRAAEARHVGAATGLSRTAQYTGAMVATSVTGLVYADGVGDEGLHVMGLVFTVAGVLLLGATFGDRSLYRRTPADDVP